MDHSAIEQAYAFFHQKEKVYRFSTSEAEKDHIENAISSYMSFNKHDISRNSCQMFGPDGKLIDRISARNIGCEYGEYDQP